jgi:hypothetical protein
MRGVLRVLLVNLAVVAVTILVAGGPAGAHVGAPETLEVFTPATSAAVPVLAADLASAHVPLWPLAALAVAALIAARIPPRRTLGLALVALLAVFAAESAVHSVHHLADRQTATQCVVALASAHVHGAAADVPAATEWLPAVVGEIALAEPDRPGARPLRPDEGRAPPA